jgi:hypothetical protein
MLKQYPFHLARDGREGNLTSAIFWSLLTFIYEIKRTGRASARLQWQWREC